MHMPMITINDVESIVTLHVHVNVQDSNQKFKQCMKHLCFKTVLSNNFKTHRTCMTLKNIQQIFHILFKENGIYTKLASFLSYGYLRILRAGVRRPCDTIELTATSFNFSLC